MPRETIHAENPGSTTELVVRWTPSMHLQLGVQSVQGHNLLDLLTGRTTDPGEPVPTGTEHGPMHRIGQAVEAVVLDYQKRHEGSYTDLGHLIMDAITGNVESSTGYWIESLSRHGTQQLIKALRRARNQVWGADE